MAMTSSDDGTFTLQLEDSRDVQMHFEVDKSDDLDAVFGKYSQFKGLSTDSLQFTYNGKNINPDESPAGLGMSNADNTIRVSLVGEALTKERISRACMSGSVSAAVDLLSQNEELCREPLGWFDSDGEEFSTPPVFIAIDYGHVELVEKLLPLHRDILDKLRNGDDYSPLQWASWTGNMDVVRLLIEEGEAKADDEALSLAREEGHDEVAEFLLKHVDLYSSLEGDSDAIMEKACREGDINEVRRLLDEGVNVEKWKDDDGKFLAFSPIYLAVRHGHMDLIQLFAERGVQVDMTDASPDVAAE